MADCSYFRCIQERRLIKRELQKWQKDMVYILGEWDIFFNNCRANNERRKIRKWKNLRDFSLLLLNLYETFHPQKLYFQSCLLLHRCCVHLVLLAHNIKWKKWIKKNTINTFHQLRTYCTTPNSSILNSSLVFSLYICYLLRLFHVIICFLSWKLFFPFRLHRVRRRILCANYIETCCRIFFYSYNFTLPVESFHVPKITEFRSHPTEQFFVPPHSGKWKGDCLLLDTTVDGLFFR